jgi:hypothetical protein
VLRGTPDCSASSAQVRPRRARRAINARMRFGSLRSFMPPRMTACSAACLGGLHRTLTLRMAHRPYRGTSSDTAQFVRRNDALITGTRLFEDRGLSPDTLYYYAVTSQDASGNESWFSTRNANKPYMPIHNGWPRRMNDNTVASSPQSSVVLGACPSNPLLRGRRALAVFVSMQHG